MSKKVFKPYRPSNGTEGEWFHEKHCYQCIYENPNPELKPKCEIMTAAFLFDLKDPEYPKEWCYDANEKPTCTKFIKWDWDNDGDPNDLDNPKAPVPEDPNQLCLPFALNEINQLIPELV